MPVPKFRTSASKRDMRRSHHALKAPGLSICSNCGEVKRPHVVCHACGFYSGKQRLEMKSNVDAKDGATGSSTEKNAANEPKE